VPAAQRKLAYYDAALPIGDGQTISSPFVVAYMTQALDPQPTDRVLEIGTGSGYQAAVLSPLVADVYTIEIVESLGNTAARTLRRLGYTNIHARIGDGFQGWAEQAPFDKIIVTCSPDKVPPPLVNQLREGGRMVIPVGQRYQQSLCLLEKVDGKVVNEVLEPTFFVPMTGRAEELRSTSLDDGVPQLVNGQFEQTDEQGLPAGWYYVRQAEVVSDDAQPDGSRWLRFTNEMPGRGAQALQALGMDGRQVGSVELSAWVSTRNVQRGLFPRQLPRIELSFFDEQRAPIGSQVLGPWHGTSDWAGRRTIVNVPPQSRLSVLAVGLFGATGELSVDRLNVAVVRNSRSNANRTPKK
jgi:protein-L-isoaspartate(D-aspartate) O-methyltransferase